MSILCCIVQSPWPADHFCLEEEEILLTTMLTIKILFTINSLKKKEKTIHSKTLFTIPVELKST